VDKPHPKKHPLFIHRRRSSLLNSFSSLVRTAPLRHEQTASRASLSLTRARRGLGCPEQRRVWRLCQQGRRPRGVWFSYSDLDGDVLKDVSFKVPARSSVPLVGPSGAGKSTVADLVSLVLRPRCGRLVVPRSV